MFKQNWHLIILFCYMQADIIVLRNWSGSNMRFLNDAPNISLR